MSQAVTAMDPSRVRAALDILRKRVADIGERSGRTGSEITIVAVTKGFGPEAIEAALAAGLRDIGENYYQEAAAKFPAVRWPHIPIRRHFIGRVQRNKARRIAALFDVVQTVDSAACADALDGAAAANEKRLQVLIQANVSADERQGVEPTDVPALAEHLRRCRWLDFRGLMVVGPHDGSRTQGVFAEAARLAASLRQTQPQATTLSMGMSADIDEAIVAGSTMLRVGSALFGQRPVARAGRRSQAEEG